MAYFVIIRGPPGAGKTTIAKELGKLIKAEVFHIDDIMYDLGLDYVQGDKWIPLEKYLKADNVMIPKYKELLKNGKNLVIECNFYFKEHIDNLINSLDSDNFVFTLKGDLEECIGYDLKRERPIGSEAVKVVSEFVSAFDYGIIIDIRRKKISEIVDEIIKHLPK